MHRRNILLFAVLFYSPRRFDIDRHAILQRCEKKKKERKEKMSSTAYEIRCSLRFLYSRETLSGRWKCDWHTGVVPISNVSFSLSSSSFYFVFYFLFPFFIVRYNDFTRSRVYRNDARITFLGNLEKADETRVSNTWRYSFLCHRDARRNRFHRSFLSSSLSQISSSNSRVFRSYVLCYVPCT